MTGDNTAAVATGLQRTGGIITSAALLLVVVIGAFSTSGITFIKMIGVGMLVAILVDATVVRALLVPAAMRLMGRSNWWAPAPAGPLVGRGTASASRRVRRRSGPAGPGAAGRRLRGRCLRADISWRDARQAAAHAPEEPPTNVRCCCAGSTSCAVLSARSTG